MGKKFQSKLGGKKVRKRESNFKPRSECVQSGSSNTFQGFPDPDIDASGGAPVVNGSSCDVTVGTAMTVF